MTEEEDGGVVINLSGFVAQWEQILHESKLWIHKSINLINKINKGVCDTFIKFFEILKRKIYQYYGRNINGSWKTMTLIEILRQYGIKGHFMTIADCQSSDNWFTITELEVSSSNCQGSDYCVIALNLSSFGNRKSQDTKEKHFFAQHTIPQH